MAFGIKETSAGTTDRAIIETTGVTRIHAPGADVLETIRKSMIERGFARPHQEPGENATPSKILSILLGSMILTPEEEVLKMPIKIQVVQMGRTGWTGMLYTFDRSDLEPLGVQGRIGVRGAKRRFIEEIRLNLTDGELPGEANVPEINSFKGLLEHMKQMIRPLGRRHNTLRDPNGTEYSISLRDISEKTSLEEFVLAIGLSIRRQNP